MPNEPRGGFTIDYTVKVRPKVENQAHEKLDAQREEDDDIAAVDAASDEKIL